MNIFTIFLSIFRKQGEITYKAKLDALRELPSLMKKRRQIQKNRRVSKVQLIKVMDWNPISPIKKLFPD